MTTRDPLGGRAGLAWLHQFRRLWLILKPSVSDLIPAVIRKLPGFELADPAQVPMVTGVLMAAAMGMDTVAWRDQFGKIPPKEALVHNFVLWLLAGLFDSLVEQPGATDRLMREVFNSMAADTG